MPTLENILVFIMWEMGPKFHSSISHHLLKIGWTVDQMAELNEIFLNAEPFIQLTRLVAGYKELINLC